MTQTLATKAPFTQYGIPHEDAVYERLLGCLIGGHVGDSLGATVEFMPRRKLRRTHRFGVHEIVGGGPFNWEPGEPTDDTQMALRIARAYEKSGGGDKLPHLTAKNFLNWMESKPKDIGNTTWSAIFMYKTRRDPFTVGAQCGHHASNGSLMRTAPVACARSLDDPRLIEDADVLGAITHSLPVCRATCITYCAILAALIEGHSPQEAIEIGYKMAPNAKLRKAIRRAQATRDLDRLPGPQGGHVLHAFRVAVWCLSHNKSFYDGLVQSIMLGDDTDTVGAIVGNMLGARDGQAGIPQKWTSKIMGMDQIMRVAPKLYEIRQNG